jgi:hypothetical protein
MTDMFSSPATATGLDLKALLGSLLLIDVHSQETGINTSFGLSDAIRADVAVLDGDSAGETYNDTLIFPKVLQSQLRSRVGGKVLGRLGQGAAKPGQSAPWTLTEPTDADKQLAVQWITQVSTPSVPEQPAPAAQPTQTGATQPPPWARSA